MIFPDPRKKYIYIWGGDGAPKKSIVKIEANMEKPQIKNTFLQSNLSKNTSSRAYLAYNSLIYFSRSNFDVFKKYFFIIFRGNDHRALTCQL